MEILISDKYGNHIRSKIDFGIHKHLEITQEGYCFDIAFDDKGASLLINSKEQMITEKLRSLLKFGRFSTRYKDIFDIYYFCDNLEHDKFMECMNTYIFSDDGMRENNMQDVVKRISKIFCNSEYKSKVDSSDKRWLDDDIDTVFDKISKFLSDLATYQK